MKPPSKHCTFQLNEIWFAGGGGANKVCVAMYEIHSEVKQMCNKYKIALNRQKPSIPYLSRKRKMKVSVIVIKTPAYSGILYIQNG